MKMHHEKDIANMTDLFRFDVRSQELLTKSMQEEVMRQFVEKISDKLTQDYFQHVYANINMNALSNMVIAKAAAEMVKKIL